MARWSEEDFGYALAWQAEQDAQCTGCGQPRDESMNPDNEAAYTASTLRCYSCAAIARKAKANGGMDAAGLFLGVRLNA